MSSNEKWHGKIMQNYLHVDRQNGFGCLVYFKEFQIMLFAEITWANDAQFVYACSAKC